MSSSTQKKPSCRLAWLSFVGDVESVASLGLLIYSFMIPVRPGTEWQSTIHGVLVLGIGAALALGGIRFGRLIGRRIGWVALIAYTVLTAALIVTSFIPREKLERFWSHMFPVM